MSKYYKVMADFYAKENESIKKEIHHFRDSNLALTKEKMDIEISSKFKDLKIELYEKIISKLMEGHPEKTDEFIMFEGKIYKLQSATLDMEPSERADILTLECVKVDFPK